jgi:UDP-glucose 4-epimerase
MHRAVITGATGMIGSSLVRECLSRGIEVVTLCRTQSPRMVNLPVGDERLTIVDCGLDGYRYVDLRAVGAADAFFHLAWAGTGAAKRNDVALQMSNVEYAVEAAALAARLGCSVFVGVGSQAECGRVSGSIRQDTPCFPENGYGMGKLAASNFTRLLCQQHGIRHEWGRILSVYGPADVPNSMVMSVLSDALAGRTPECTKGEQVWDYLYCDDSARALLAIAERGIDGSVYPIGSGNKRYLAEYIEDICDACGTGVRPNLGARPYANGQVMHLTADISALSADTGWSPEVSFYTGIRRTIKWYETHSCNTE